MGPIVDFAGLLAKKYAILQQEADNRGLGLRAQANLDTIRAGLLPAESKANVGLTTAQAALAAANARNVDETTKFVGPIARSEIGLRGSQSRLYGAQATGEEQLNNTKLFKFRGLGDDLGAIDSAVRNSFRLGLGPFAGY